MPARERNATGGSGGRTRSPAAPLSAIDAALFLSTATWLLLACGAVACGLLFPDTAAGDARLAAEVRRHLVATELAWLLLPSALPGLALVVLGHRRRSARRFAIGLGALLFLAYMAAWGTFRFVGRFPDVRALIMLASDSVQLVQHALHLDSAGVARALAGTVVATVLWCRLVGKALSCSPRSRIALTAAFGAIAALCLATAMQRPELAGAGHRRVVDPEAGVDMLLGEFVEEAESARTGPLLRLRAALHETSRVPSPAEARAALAACTMRPIVSMQDWLASVDTSAARRLNVILVEVESLRNDELTAFGGPRSVMPTVDALARAGRIFTRHYTLSSHSNYADIPPLSSHYPLRSPWYHIYPENPPYPRVLVYDVLHALGYRTAVVSSQNENWGGMANYLRTAGLDAMLHSANFDGDTYVARGDTGFNAFAARFRKSGKVDDSATIDRAIDWIESDPERRPFFLYLNLQNSHVPYETPASFDAPFPRPDPWLKIQFHHIPADRVAEVRDAYSNSLAYIDEQIARLLAHLRESGTLEETLVVIGGDNGEAFLEHGFSAHASALYDEVVHTPVVFHAPGLPPGEDDRLAATLDIAPTILDILGLPAHPAWQGRSLLGPRPSGDRSVFLVAQTPLAHQYAVVRGRHKLIRDHRSGAVVLYDLVADPREKKNLASREEALRDDLSARLDLWVTAQLAYYADPTLYCCRYPPMLPD